MAMRLAEVEASYPAVPWRTPLAVTVTGDPAWYLVCRLCVAEFGLAASWVKERSFDTPEAFERHLAEAHDADKHE